MERDSIEDAAGATGGWNEPLLSVGGRVVPAKPGQYWEGKI